MLTTAPHFWYSAFQLDTTTNKGQIYIIVCTIVFLAGCCVLTNCYLAYLGKEAPQAFTLLTGGLVGAVTSMLVKTTPTETTKQPLPTAPTPPPTDEPIAVTVENKPGDPVPTTEIKT